MNLIEHREIKNENFDRVYMGRVFDISDPLSIGRVKVRVFGVYEEPIKEGHIPWAVPSNAKRVRVGDVVAVFFSQGNLYRPVLI